LKFSFFPNELWCLSQAISYRRFSGDSRSSIRPIPRTKRQQGRRGVRKFGRAKHDPLTQWASSSIGRTLGASMLALGRARMPVLGRFST